MHLAASPCCRQPRTSCSYRLLISGGLTTKRQNSPAHFSCGRRYVQLPAVPVKDTDTRAEEALTSTIDWGDDIGFTIDWDGGSMPANPKKGHLLAILKALFLLGAMVAAAISAGNYQSKVPVCSHADPPAPIGISDTRSAGGKGASGEERFNEVNPSVSGPEFSIGPEDSRNNEPIGNEVSPQIDSETSFEEYRGDFSALQENSKDNSPFGGDSIELSEENSEELAQGSQSLVETDWIIGDGFDSETKVDEYMELAENQEDRSPPNIAENSMGQMDVLQEYSKNHLDTREIEMLADSVSMEGLKQRAILAARAALAASEAAQIASNHSAAASAAAHEAVSAANEAVSSAAIAHGALDRGSKREVLLAEKRVLEAAQIALGAEARARDAAAQVGPHRDNATQQADAAADLASLRHLRGSSVMEQIRDSVQSMWILTLGFLQTVAHTVSGWLKAIWQSMCSSWPELQARSHSVSLVIQKVVGDFVWLLHEGWGLLGDVCDRVMSGATDLSTRACVWAKANGLKIWNIIVKQYGNLINFLQMLVLHIKNMFRS